MNVLVSLAALRKDVGLVYHLPIQNQRPDWWFCPAQGEAVELNINRLRNADRPCRHCMKHAASVPRWRQKYFGWLSFWGYMSAEEIV